MKSLNRGILAAFSYITLLCPHTASLVLADSGKKKAEKVKKDTVLKILPKGLESFSVAVVGKDVITDQDVKSRLLMESVFFHRAITKKTYLKMYTQAVQSLVNESRQSQAPYGLLEMAKKSFQTEAVRPLLPEEIKKEVDSSIGAMAKSSSVTFDDFVKQLGPHYASFYKRQKSMVTFQRFLMLKYGSRAMRNITDNAVAKERKKWKLMQNSVQYRISEIVIYNRMNDGSDYEKMLEIASLLESGDGTFSEMAYQSSEAQTNENGGDSGWDVLENFDRPIQAFLRTASIGDISPVIALPTARHPEKWVLVLYKDQRNPEKGSETKDPGDDFFRNALFGAQLDRLSKIEMEELKKSFPCTLNIPKNMEMPLDLIPAAPQSVETRYLEENTDDHSDDGDEVSDDGDEVSDDGDEVSDDSVENQILEDSTQGDLESLGGFGGSLGGFADSGGLVGSAGFGGSLGGFADSGGLVD